MEYNKFISEQLSRGLHAIKWNNMNKGIGQVNIRFRNRRWQTNIKTILLRFCLDILMQYAIRLCILVRGLCVFYLQYINEYIFF